MSQLDMFATPPQQAPPVPEWTAEDRRFMERMDSVFDSHCEACRCHDLCFPTCDNGWHNFSCGGTLLVTWKD